jgi:hypothetical protein
LLILELWQLELALKLPLAITSGEIIDDIVDELLIAIHVLK